MGWLIALVSLVAGITVVIGVGWIFIEGALESDNEEIVRGFKIFIGGLLIFLVFSPIMFQYGNLFFIGAVTLVTIAYLLLISYEPYLRKFSKRFGG